ncbi:uncharacterized protein LOC121732036 [Aricia agestis]|uniref:uncharacterized protein LOC121732036 n=1 Tax=Aricia agestis TaxID=91739 RepID=UPI001C20544B|nr:uncharacterized protein LOC121732036 [Aricia agestis]
MMAKKRDGSEKSKSKKSIKSAVSVKSNATGATFVDNVNIPHLDVSLILEGSPGQGDWILLVIFNGITLSQTNWEDKVDLPEIQILLNLEEANDQTLLADQPLLFLLRTTSSKAAKSSDPLLNHENKAGCSADLLPILLGERKIKVMLPLISLATGKHFNCSLDVCVTYSEENIPNIEKIPLLITLLSAHCLPSTKDAPLYAGAMELANVHSPIHFGISNSDSTTENILWASAAAGGRAAYTNFRIPAEDVFIPWEFDPLNTKRCFSIYWNAMRRILVDPESLRDRLKSQFFVEIAAAQKSGKIDSKYRYMASIDAGVLLEANQYGVTTCAKLVHFDNANFPENVKTILEVPPSSAKARSEHNDTVADEFGHYPYIVVRFDLYESLTSKTKTLTYYENLGILPPDGLLSSVFELDHPLPQPDDKGIDVSCIRKEAGALAVHEELSKLVSDSVHKKDTCNKKSACNNLSTRVKTMLRNFQVQKTDHWQNVLASQYRACQRSVQASFAPNLDAKPPIFSRTFAAARARIAGDTRISMQRIKIDLKRFPEHPKPLLALALRCLEESNGKDALTYLYRSLKSQPRNKYVLWTLGAVEFSGSDPREVSKAAFNIAVMGDVCDGITGVIGWAALHTRYHFKRDSYGAFLAAKKMRKWFELEQPWRQFLDRWMSISGEKEIYWDPKAIKYYDPLLFASAFFLCLRCYEFSEQLLFCFKNGCTTRGSRFNVAHTVTNDVYYIRVASLILRKQVTDALVLIDKNVRKFCPSTVMSQMRAVATILLGEWNKDCENAIDEAERMGSKLCPFILYNAGLAKIYTDIDGALQYAARAYKLDSSAFTALLIARIYGKMGNEDLAQRWAAVAVNDEPLLSDGWAFLATLALREQNVTKAISMLRTSEQAGPLSPEIEKDLKKVMKTVGMDSLPMLTSKDICLCEYF